MAGPVLLGEIIADSRSASFLGLSDRGKIISYITRALDLAIYKANYNPSIGTLDINADSCGWVTLPSFVGTILACNVNGQPSWFQSAWFEYSQNGPGSTGIGANWSTAGWFGYNGYGMGGGGGSWNGQTWADREFSPTYRDLTEWSAVAAICENTLDGTGALKMIVTGETQNALGDSQIQTVEIPLLTNTATTDAQSTLFRRITAVVKPPTKGFVKLLGVPTTQGADGIQLGYYAPNEVTPRYRRIRVNSPCAFVRVRYRRTELPLVNDYDVIPIASRQAMLELIKSLVLSDSNNFEAAQAYQAHARAIIDEIEAIENGPGQFQIQIDPGYGVGSLDVR